MEFIILFLTVFSFMKNPHLTFKYKACWLFQSKDSEMKWLGKPYSVTFLTSLHHGVLYIHSLSHELYLLYFLSKETTWVSCQPALHSFVLGSNPTKHQSSSRWEKYKNFPLMKTQMTLTLVLNSFTTHFLVSFSLIIQSLTRYTQS